MYPRFTNVTETINNNRLLKKQGTGIRYKEQTNQLLNRIEAQVSHGIFDICDDMQVYQHNHGSNKNLQDNDKAPFQDFNLI